MRSVSIQAIADLIKRGKLRGHKVAGRTVLLRSEVEAFVPLPLGRPPKNIESKKTVAKKTPKKTPLGEKTGPKKATPKKTTD